MTNVEFFIEETSFRKTGRLICCQESSPAASTGERKCAKTIYRHQHEGHAIDLLNLQLLNVTCLRFELA
jgi:hypothetical protein